MCSVSWVRAGVWRLPVIVLPHQFSEILFCDSINFTQNNISVSRSIGGSSADEKSHPAQWTGWQYGGMDGATRNHAATGTANANQGNPHWRIGNRRLRQSSGGDQMNNKSVSNASIAMKGARRGRALRPSPGGPARGSRGLPITARLACDYPRMDLRIAS
jgi:hypothetical protein